MLALYPGPAYQQVHFALTEPQGVKRYPIGFLHMGIAEVQTAGGKLYLFVAIDRTSKFAVAQLIDKMTRELRGSFSNTC